MTERTSFHALADLPFDEIVPALMKRFERMTPEELDFALRMLDAPRPLPAVGPAPVDRLRAILQRNPAVLLPEAARELNLSVRSFQRYLVQAGTTFRNEVVHARATRAVELLSTTRAPQGEIARSVGLHDKHLTAVVLRATGKTPSQLRPKHIPRGLIGVRGGVDDPRLEDG
jgi:AraC-like DNA-binding protein